MRAPDRRNWMEAAISDFRRFTSRDVLDLIHDYRQLMEDLREADRPRKIAIYVDLVRAEVFVEVACHLAGRVSCIL